jgi:hypothetical protein
MDRNRVSHNPSHMSARDVSPEVIAFEAIMRQSVLSRDVNDDDDDDDDGSEPESNDSVDFLYMHKPSGNLLLFDIERLGQQRIDGSVVFVCVFG